MAHAWSKPKGGATCTKCGCKRRLESKSGGRYRTTYLVPGMGPKGGSAEYSTAPSCSTVRNNPSGWATIGRVWQGPHGHLKSTVPNPKHRKRKRNPDGGGVYSISPMPVRGNPKRRHKRRK